MPRLSRRPPAYTLHKRSGNARVQIDGKDHSLGPYGSKESKKRYAELIAEWAARQDGTARPKATTVTVGEAIMTYRGYAAKRYRQEGEATSEVDNIRVALKPVRKLFGMLPLAEFGPVKFRAVRQSMADAKLARTLINARMGRVRRWARWCVAEELAPADLLHRLEAVTPLMPGEEGIEEAAPVLPVDRAHVDAALARVRPPIRAMIELQLACGCRPGEATRITTGQIDRAGEVWIYRPTRHKTKHRGRAREIYLGPRAQAILTPWLRADPETPLFSPAEDHDARMAEKRGARKTKVQPSQVDRSKPGARRRPGASYSVRAYSHAIRRACDEAGIDVWGPNRLRHSYATTCRATLGLEYAQAALGHSRPDTTLIYAERDTAKALEAARKLG